MTIDRLEELNNYIEPKLFKSVLGGFTTGITVITVKDSEGGLHGFTASSFTSLSLQPPLILFCLHNDSSTLPALKDQKKCAISILNENQREISENFAYKKGDKFAGIDYKESKNFKYPIITNALGWLECSVVNNHLEGDHTIFICRVIDLARDHNEMPLVYYSGKYNKL
ncbi:MAG: putative oxidoreductase [Rickettsiaceae bacterium]|jgi:flavin reductase (DIM6/NTAB) family NADH-FMN oxidoreductase RutF|nr:putative oxidoreductase [Rickettsiaceae bacterium]